MKSFFTYLLMISLAFLFGSCQVEEDVVKEYVVKEYTGAEYLSTFATPPAMFLVSIQDATVEDAPRKGFLIDNKGNLKKLDVVYYSVGIHNPNIHAPALQTMVDKGETVMQVDLDMLVEQYKKVRLAGRSKRITEVSTAKPAENIEFYGYTYTANQDAEHNGSNNCQGASSTSSTLNHAQYMLKSMGENAISLNSELATQLTDWLHGLAVESATK